jgi:DME family drug/metabolite transporter
MLAISRLRLDDTRMLRVSSGRLAVVSVLGAACLWGTSGPAQALAASGANPAAVGAARLLLGGLVLGAVAVASGTPVRTWLCGRDWRWLVLAAVSTGVFRPGPVAAPAEAPS